MPYDGKFPGTEKIKAYTNQNATYHSDSVDDAYGSCSKCGTYESVRLYEDCSCRMKKPPTRGSHEMLRSVKETPAIGEKVEIDCDGCDTDSCHSSEKCYCSLRGDPRLRLRNSSNKTYTTSLYTDSGTVTDSTCYSSTCLDNRSKNLVRHQNHPGFDSPQTAWRKNIQSPLSDACSCSDYSDSGILSNSRISTDYHMSNESPATLRRKNSYSGSGYQSNDSYASRPPVWHQKENPMRSTETHDGRGSAGFSSSSSSSSPQSISSPHLSSHSSEHQLSSKHNKSKMLLHSAHDPRGNVVYRGASTKRPKPQTETVVTKSARDEDNIMSLKKSAEIAAMFSGARINQTTDLVDHLDTEYSDSVDLRELKSSENHNNVS